MHATGSIGCVREPRICHRSVTSSITLDTGCDVRSDAVQVGTKPTAAFTAGQELKVAVLPALTHKHRRVMLSCVPSVVSAAESDGAMKSPAADATDSEQHVAANAKEESFPVGSKVVGVVEHIGKDSISVALSNSFSAHVYCLHVSERPEVAMALQEHFEIGSVVHGAVIEAHERRTSLSLLPSNFAALYRGSPGPKVRNPAS